MMQKSPVLYFLGLFLKIFSAILVFPLAVGKMYGEPFSGLESYIYASIVSFGLGIALMRYGLKRQPTLVESLFTATGAWISIVAIGAIPFVKILGMSYVDAYFEAMSGFTTGGITLIPSLESIPKSVLFFRAFMQWIGGLGILTLFISIVSESGGGVAQQLFSAETHKAENQRTQPNLINSTISLWKVYAILTVTLTSILIILNMSFFDAVTHAFTTISTGGFSNYSNGLGHFNSAAIEYVIAAFMLVSGINFILLYNALEGNIRMMLTDFEARLYIGIFSLSSAIMFLDISANGAAFHDALRLAVFYSASIISTTGFTTTSIQLLPNVTFAIILGLLLVGGCVGSTSGGLKVLRFGVFMKLISRAIKRMDSPKRAIDSIVINRKIMDDRNILNAATILFLWFVTIFVGSVMTLAFADIPVFIAIENMFSIVSTTGILFISRSELIALPAAVKLIYSFGLLAGRLEIIPLLAIFKIRLRRYKR